MWSETVENKNNPPHHLSGVLPLLLLGNCIHKCLVLLHNPLDALKEREQAVLGVKQHLSLSLVLTLLSTSLSLDQTQDLQLEVLVCAISPPKAVSDALDRTEAKSGSQKIPARSSHHRRHRCA